MNTRTTSLLCIPLALVALSAGAQDTDEATVGQVRSSVRSSGQGVAIARTTGPAWLEKKIDIDIRNASVKDAVKSVLAAAGVAKFDFATETDIPTEMRLTVAVKGVRARDALAAVSRLGGAVAYVSQSDKETVIQLRPRTENAPIVIPMPNQPRILPDIPTIFGNGRAALANKKVSLDRRDTDLRDILKELLKKAEVDFVLEDGVPDDARRSFVFNDIPLSSALDLICQSADLAWSVNQTGKRQVVRIYKPKPRQSLRGNTTISGASR